MYMIGYELLLSPPQSSLPSLRHPLSTVGLKQQLNTSRNDKKGMRLEKFLRLKRDRISECRFSSKSMRIVGRPAPLHVYVLEV